ncbi:hypothetical protein NX059_005719 [Plenodomus lindquistii]|nr:hypothetical protein NX059_005719 [Plenodomus lindquistii]
MSSPTSEPPKKRGRPKKVVAEDAGPAEPVVKAAKEAKEKVDKVVKESVKVVKEKVVKEKTATKTKTKAAPVVDAAAKEDAPKLNTATPIAPKAAPSLKETTAAPAASKILEEVKAKAGLKTGAARAKVEEKVVASQPKTTAPKATPAQPTPITPTSTEIPPTQAKASAPKATLAKTPSVQSTPVAAEAAPPSPRVFEGKVRRKFGEDEGMDARGFWNLSGGRPGGEVR